VQAAIKEQAALVVVDTEVALMLALMANEMLVAEAVLVAEVEIQIVLVILLVTVARVALVLLAQ
jgi:hypothetical protein